MKPFLQDTGKQPGIPSMTLCMTVISLLLTLSGNVATFLQYDRAAIGDGELWRIVTGHWVHWSFDHLLWCSITFFALGYVCEVISPRGFLATLITASLAIPVLLWFAEPGMQAYRGLSGLASAVFVYGAMLLTHRAYIVKDWPRFLLFVAAGTGYVAKILYEFITSSTIFVESTDLFSPVPLAHLSGGVAGAVTFFAVYAVESIFANLNRNACTSQTGHCRPA